MLLLSIAGGCASSDYLQARSSPRNPLNSQLQLLSRSGPHATQRTSRLLRRYALEDNDGNTDAVLQRLAEEITREPKSEKVYAYAELAYIGGRQAQEKGDDAQALKLYGGSVMHSFMYLFDPQFDLERNPYDPQFRGACDLYNGALEGALRLVAKQGKLKPGAIQHVKFGDKDAGLRLVVNGPWHDDEFERFEFVSDFEIKGLNNRHHSYGLGVPMIAVRRRHVNEASYEEHYPPGLSFAVTAFLRLRPGQQGEPHRMCTIELFDALDTQTANVGDYLVPLETDLSTALAYSLDRPEFREKQQLATTGFLDPNKGKKAQGLYMLEPYDENKIPVLMVHGLWSDPLTWMEMFNDLRSFPELRSRYQFWFYLYPTGQPFWVSATQLRDDLASLQSKLDPSSKNPALGQMVLVGHSMGGLVSRMQVINSEERLRELISEKPLDQVKLSDDEREHIRKVVYFRPNPAVKRVVSIGTPYRGSNFANDYTRWLSRKLITVPKRMVQAQQRLLNLDGLQNSELLRITTSIDSLAPSSPILKPLRESPAAPWVTTHNIVGVVSENGFIGRFAGESDGVVDRTSAHFEQAKTELVVEADHTTIHQNPRAILEVRRILLEHLETADYQLARVPFPSGAPAIAPPPIEMGSEPHEHH
ncbi:MAG: alpha/beta fold hydrolase [Planctomycetales bacterium]|nr:alpha/beta fold hydrolase [Planctomycetales bacterium]